MRNKAFRRRILQLLAVLAAAVALPLEAKVAPSSAQVRTAESDAAYQRLVDAANAVVGLKVLALANARSNESLGRARNGSGVLISEDGLVLTASYLVLEAEQVEVTDSRGTTVPGAVVAYDHVTGLALVKAVGPLAIKPIRMGTASPVAQLDRLMIVTGGEEQTVSIATVVSKRRFAGYWEYLLDDAIFTSPPRLDHSGAALVNERGELVGIGSLFVLDALAPGQRLPGNMFVPIDALKPVLAELVAHGAQKAAERPWLGVNSLEEDGRVKVIQVNEESPAHAAGIVAGDIILSLDGEPVQSLEGFYRRLWARGAAGVEVTLGVLHGATLKQVTVRTMDRRDFMRRKPSI